MASSSSSIKYQNWPDAVEHKIPYKAPAKGSNPAVRGFVLSVGAPLVAKFGFVSKFLYKNAGFNKLDKLKELKDISHRYDPTVIPVLSDAERAAEVPDFANPNRKTESLLDKKEPLFYSVRDYHDMYKSGNVTPLDVAKTLLPLVRRDIKGRSIHSTAFLTTREDLVLAAAEASTLRWAEGKPLGLLDGVPLAIKDEVQLAGYTQSFGTKHTMDENTETSWCVTKWEEAGAVIIGKTNMHEVGMDTTNNNPVHGTPKNPYNENYYTGGSSGGSGYVVAAGLVPVALGCDGGGSIRIPANYCGIYGLKTSHSRVSTHPSPDLAGTTSVTGPMAIDMDSLAVTYRVMATPDPKVSASVLFGPSRPPLASRKKVLGIFRPWYDNSDPSVKAACDATLEYLRTTHGYSVVDIELPLVPEGQLAHAMTILLEVLNAVGDHKYLQPANRILMSVASNASANDFLNAQKLRQITMQHLAHLFDLHGHDLIIVSPTTPNAGWSFTKADLKSGISDGDMTIKSMQYAWLANFAGNPAISVPVGYVVPKVGEDKIPVGLMGMGIWGGEEGLIRFGFECEKYLHDVIHGGRLKPKNWVDVLKLAAELGNIDEEVNSIETAKGNAVNGAVVPPPVPEKAVPAVGTETKELPSVPAEADGKALLAEKLV